MARADFEIRGMSQADIVRKYGVTRGAVSQRVAAEGWQAGKTKQLQEKKVNALIALAETEHETKQGKLNALERAVRGRSLYLCHLRPARRCQPCRSSKVWIWRRYPMIPTAPSLNASCGSRNTLAS